MNRLVLSSLLLVACSCANTSQMMGTGGDTSLAQARFERIKTLAGEWTGSSSDPSMKEGNEVRYRVVSNGSAVEEIFMPGQPHEMISMYHMNGSHLMMTHYCAVGNQPRMVATSESTTGAISPIRFEFLDATNLASNNDGHMHSMEMTFQDANHFSSSWTYFEDGKASHTATFKFTRKATSTAWKTTTFTSTHSGTF